MEFDANICRTAKASLGTLVWEMTEEVNRVTPRFEASVSKVVFLKLSGSQQRGEGIAP